MKARIALHLLLIVGSASLSPIGKAVADDAVARTLLTDHYRIALEIGPLPTMLMPDQASGASEGEVMVGMPGMPMAMMAMTDQGQSVNRHVEVHVYDKGAGAVLSTPMPMIAITDQTSGTSRELHSVALMYDVKLGPQDLHFGQNLYLPAGTYAVKVTIGGEQATFKEITLGNP